MRIIILGVPHVPTVDPTVLTKKDIFPFSEQNWNLCKILHSRGHEVIHLGIPGSSPPCTENIDVVPLELWQKQFGSLSVTQLYQIKPNHCPAYTQEYIKNVKEVINKIAPEPLTALVLANWGGDQETACKGLSQFVVEPGVGYVGVWAPYRVYSSYAWMHFQLGRLGLLTGDQWYHVVIPQPIDTNLFGPVVPTLEKKNYLLYLGRMAEDKGVRLACQVAREINTPIILAGRDYPQDFIREWPTGITWISNPTVEKRKELLRYAKGMFAPTRYVEPWGNTVLEAGASGCPVITTDWGAFTETCKHGVTGYRCRTFEQFVWAAKNISNIEPKNCRNWIETSYNFDKVGLMYEEYFQSLLNLKTEKGWNLLNPDRKTLDWLRG